VSGRPIRGRNFHYLIACPETGEALAIDPLEPDACLAGRATGLDASVRSSTPTSIPDHTGGNAAMVARHRRPVLAHERPRRRASAASTHGFGGGDLVRVGRTVQLACLDTPGHTRAHLCLYAARLAAAAPALFSGDTLFNAGVGNCIHGGDPRCCMTPSAASLAQMPAATRVFPGHEYLLRNLGFTLDREPSNKPPHATGMRAAPGSGGRGHAGADALARSSRSTCSSASTTRVIAGLREGRAIVRAPAPLTPGARELRNRRLRELRANGDGAAGRIRAPHGPLPILNPLNDAQREAVTAPLGPVLVLAGAGSGKTRVLIAPHRLADPDRRRLPAQHPGGDLHQQGGRGDARPGRAAARDPGRALWLGTFHGIAHRLLRLHWREAGLPQGFQILDAEDQLRLIKKVLKAQSSTRTLGAARGAVLHQQAQGRRPPAASICRTAAIRPRADDQAVRAVRGEPVRARA
jgi:hydroxyacylglutathione hydrolase